MSLEHARTGGHAVCATLAEADAVLTRWSWSEAGPDERMGPEGGRDGDVGRGEPEADTVYCVAQWADGTRLVVQYNLPRDPGGARADLGAAIRAQCDYSAGRRRPPGMSPEDYQGLMARAGRKTIERYERMLATLEM